MRLIDANALKEIREKFIRGGIHFDYECDMDKCLRDYKEGVHSSFTNLAKNISAKIDTLD